MGFVETPPLTRGRLRLFLKLFEQHRNTPAYAGKTSLAAEGSWRRKKHPRLRGEDGLFRAISVIHRETPPLTRGRLERQALCLESVGNTPAYAGKTTTDRYLATGAEKHPRLRGEDSAPSAPIKITLETPPLTRGRPLQAGTDIRPWGKHPRLRGEDSGGNKTAYRIRETPPLTRGRHNVFIRC